MRRNKEPQLRGYLLPRTPEEAWKYAASHLLLSLPPLPRGDVFGMPIKKIFIYQSAKGSFDPEYTNISRLPNGGTEYIRGEHIKKVYEKYKDGSSDRLVDIIASWLNAIKADLDIE